MTIFNVIGVYKIICWRIKPHFTFLIFTLNVRNNRWRRPVVRVQPFQARSSSPPYPFLFSLISSPFLRHEAAALKFKVWEAL